MDGVIAIGENVGPGQFNWFATGTLFAEVVQRDRKAGTYEYVPWLVTNQHVFRGESHVWIRLNLQDATAKDFRIELTQGKDELWTAHPGGADIAVFCLDAAQLRERQIAEAYLKSDIHCWRIDDMRRNGVVEGDGVFVMGYPLGLMSQGTQLPIARMGIIARVRDAYSHLGRPYLVDANITEGNSGGPVAIRPELTALRNTATHSESMIIGIVSHVEMYSANGQVQTEGGQKVRSRVPAGLALVHPIDTVMETISAHRNVHGAIAAVEKQAQ